MGFSAYILETLNRYGKVDLGALGSFDLNYSPARWRINKQYFDPPHSTLTWQPAVGNSAESSSSPLAGVIASMHDIPFDQAASYCKTQLDHLIQSIQENQIVIRPLGVLSKNKDSGTLEFIKESSFDSSIKFEPLRLSKISQHKNDHVAFQWGLVILSALILSVLYFLIYQYVEYKNNHFQTNPISLETYPAKTSVMTTNIAPMVSDTIMRDVQGRIQDTSLKNSKVIIITGTFCKPMNAEKMKALIATQGYTLNEEVLDNGCVRLGIPLTRDEHFEEKLLFIRKNIEPSAWVLDQ